MCGTSESSTSTSTQLDPLDREAKSVAISRGLDILNQSYPGYDWTSRTAPLTSNQQTAFQNVANFAASPVTANAERIVDESGRLGAISDYIDPYLQQAIAPSIREIQRAGQIQRNDLGGNFTHAGAFGGARHGVAEAEQMKNEQQTISDLLSTAYSNAYNTALGQRAGDLDRFLNTDVLRDQMTLNRALSLLGVGDQEQEQQQKIRDAQYGEYLRGVEWPFRQFDLLPSVLSGTPTAQTVTQTTQQPNNILSGLLGSAIGALF